MAKTTRTTATRPRATAAKAAAPAPDAAPGAEPPADAAPAAEALSLKDLIEQVIARTDLKKKDVKPVVEAALAVLGEALTSGRPLNLPPFGRMRVNRRKDSPNGEMLNLRLRRGGAGGGKRAEKDAENAKEPLAAAEE